MSYNGCKCQPECFTFQDHVGTGPHVSSAATPSRSQCKETAEAVEREKRWGPDMDAYKRLRKDKQQPKTVLGCAALERDATDSLEIRRGKVYGDKLEKHKEATELVDAVYKGKV